MGNKKNIITLRLAAALVMAAIATISYIIWNGSETGWNLLLILIPVGLITDGLIHSTLIVNSMKKAPAKAHAFLYCFDLAFPYLWITALSIIGLMPMATIAIFLTLAVTIGCSKTMMHSLDGGFGIIADIDQRTFNLNMMFQGLLAISLIIEKFV